MAVAERRCEPGLRPFSLSFKDASLEKEFRERNDDEARGFNQAGMILSYVAWFAFILFSSVSFPEHFALIVKTLVFFLFPIFTINLIVLSSPRYRKRAQLATAVSNGAAGLGVIYFGHFVLQKDILTLFGITVVVLFAFFILRLRYVIAFWTTLSYVAVYQAALLATGSGANEIGLVSFLLWVLQSSCVAGGSILERANRKTFHQNKLRQSAEEKIANMAYHDPLTGLSNRLLFTEKLKEFVDARRPVAVMFIDLDQFKMINDTRGHSVGDELLQQVARRLVDCVGAQDSVSRIGGDEFTILLPNKSKAEVARIAEKIVEEVRKPFSIGDAEFFIRASIGINFYPTDGDNMETLIKYADIAMYRSKESGGNNYKFFTSSMRRSLEERANLERLLHTALANDEFVLFYQPQIDLRTGRISGVEAFIRWVHPRRGPVPPNQFIPIAEETGLILPIGDWVLRTACVQAEKWNRERGRPLRLAVNLSVKQFLANDIVVSVDRTIRETGLHPNLLELELTESIFLQNMKSVVGAMNQFKDMGLRILIDDFGTGYASLTYLRDFPIDALKIHRQFVGDLPENKKSVAIVSAVLALARNMGIQSVAEGVETLDQLNFFQAEGCDFAQGNHFGPPLPEDQITPLLRDSGRRSQLG